MDRFAHVGGVDELILFLSVPVLYLLYRLVRRIAEGWPEPSAEDEDLDEARVRDAHDEPDA